MKAGLYIRVSTKEQTENYSIPDQKEKLEAFCKSKGWEIHDYYIDGGYSGSNTDRPHLKRMLSDIEHLDVVIVYKLDRLSRSQKDTLELIEEHFLKNEVEFVSMTETIDTSTPFGRAMIGILSVFAQLERENITERMRNGHIRRIQKGYRVMGGDYDPAGYRREEDDLVLIPEEAKHIQETYNLYEQYHSITKVQEKLKLQGYPVWRFRRYRDILSNRLYIGDVSYSGEYYKGRHQPIITTEQFERVQYLLERHKGKNAHKAKESLLSGLMICGDCGEKYVSYSTGSKNKKYRYYICRARRFPSEYPEKCMNKNWNAYNLENLIVESIKNFVSDATLKENNKPKNIDYKKMEQKIDAKLNRILDLYADGNIDKKRLDDQVFKINEEKEKLLQSKKKHKQTDVLTPDFLENAYIDIDAADFPTKQAITQKLIKEIVISNNDIKIVWNF